MDVLLQITTDGCGLVSIETPDAGLEPIILHAPEDGNDEDFTEETVAAVRELLERLFIPGR